MQLSSLHFFPVPLPYVIVLLFIVVILISLIEIGILRYAYEKMGVNRRYIFALLLLSLLGSSINIPIAELPKEHIRSGEEIIFFGMRYVVPVVKDWPRTILAVNLGGAIVPIILSIYLLIKNGDYLKSVIGVVLVTAVVHHLAQPVMGIGIAVPIFIPPLIAAGAALLLSRRNAPAIAYIAGALGTLIGGDLLHLGDLQGLGAPIVSIGGAGTFDGIFMTGILAVLLA
jgi:uncharacterized membrane protein